MNGNNKRKTMKTKRNMKLQQSGIAIHQTQTKLQNQSQETTNKQKRKTRNKHNDSIPMVPKESST